MSNDASETRMSPDLPYEVLISLIGDDDPQVSLRATAFFLRLVRGEHLEEAERLALRASKAARSRTNREVY